MFGILKVFKNPFDFRCLQDDDMEHDRWRPPIKRRKKSMQKYLLNFIMTSSVPILKKMMIIYTSIYA